MRRQAEDVARNGAAGCTALLGDPGEGKRRLLQALAQLPWPEAPGSAPHAPGREQGGGTRRAVLVEAGGWRWRSAGGVAGHDALVRAGLGALAKRRLDTLAPGERRAVMLARAVGAGAAALLLDDPEPALLAAARRAGTAVVFATTRSELALTADRLVVMLGGQAVRAGAVAEIYDDPRRPDIAALLGATNVIRGTVREVYPTGFAWTAGGQRFRQLLRPGLERPPLGREVLLLLWPERLVPLLAEDASDNAVAGTAVAVRFASGRPVLDLDTGLGRLIAALGPYAPPLPGSAVRLGWASGSATLLRDAE